MLTQLYLQHGVQSPTGAPISGENLHIVKGRDKLRELSRVPTVYQYGMQSECPIHTILKYFSFLAFQNCSLPCIWIYFIPTHSLFYKNSFLSGFLYTHTHTHENVWSLASETPDQHPGHAFKPTINHLPGWIVLSRSLTDVHITSRRIP